MIKNSFLKKGISLVEVIVAITIISLSMIYISNVYGNFVNLSLQNTDKVQAVFLLDEGVEALKTIRNYSWSSIGSLSSANDYYLIWQGGRWQATTTPNVIDNKFVRKFNIENVFRDPSSLNIVTTGGNLDLDSKIINIEVSWQYKGITSTKENSFYIFNLYE